jgi:hypothetical protein
LWTAKTKNQTSLTGVTPSGTAPGDTNPSDATANIPRKSVCNESNMFWDAAITPPKFVSGKWIEPVKVAELKPICSVPCTLYSVCVCTRACACGTSAGCVQSMITMTPLRPRYLHMHSFTIQNLNCTYKNNFYCASSATIILTGKPLTSS